MKGKDFSDSKWCKKEATLAKLIPLFEYRNLYRNLL